MPSVAPTTCQDENEALHAAMGDIGQALAVQADSESWCEQYRREIVFPTTTLELEGDGRSWFYCSGGQRTHELLRQHCNFTCRIDCGRKCANDEPLLEYTFQQAALQTRGYAEFNTCDPTYSTYCTAEFVGQYFQLLCPELCGQCEEGSGWLETFGFGSPTASPTAMPTPALAQFVCKELPRTDGIDSTYLIEATSACDSQIGIVAAMLDQCAADPTSGISNARHPTCTRSAVLNADSIDVGMINGYCTVLDDTAMNLNNLLMSFSAGHHDYDTFGGYNETFFGRNTGPIFCSFTNDLLQIQSRSDCLQTVATLNAAYDAYQTGAFRDCAPYELSESPTTSDPTVSPTASPTSSEPTVAPTTGPTTSAPTASPTTPPSSSVPTIAPTRRPTVSEPTSAPTLSDTGFACVQNGNTNRGILTVRDNSTLQSVCNTYTDRLLTLLTACGLDTIERGAETTATQFSCSSVPRLPHDALVGGNCRIAPDVVPTAIATLLHRYGFADTADNGLIGCSTASDFLQLPLETCSSTAAALNLIVDDYLIRGTFVCLAPTAAPSTSPSGSAPSTSPSGSAPTSAPSTTAPNMDPTPAPTRAPTSLPTGEPTATPSNVPSGTPSVAPSTSAPTLAPTPAPTAVPTVDPCRTNTCSRDCGGGCGWDRESQSCKTGFSTSPEEDEALLETALGACARYTLSPSASPSLAPTALPTSTPTAFPTSMPTSAPSDVPSDAPSGMPTSDPTAIPTLSPSASPTLAPTASAPSGAPSNAPSATPTSSGPTAIPTLSPSTSPTLAPTPSQAPTLAPSASPIASPTSAPTGLSDSPTSSPSAAPAELNLGRASTSGNDEDDEEWYQSIIFILALAGLCVLVCLILIVVVIRGRNSSRAPKPQKVKSKNKSKHGDMNERRQEEVPMQIFTTGMADPYEKTDHGASVENGNFAANIYNTSSPASYSVSRDASQLPGPDDSINSVASRPHAEPTTPARTGISMTHFNASTPTGSPAVAASDEGIAPPPARAPPSAPMSPSMGETSFNAVTEPPSRPPPVGPPPSTASIHIPGPPPPPTPSGGPTFLGGMKVVDLASPMTQNDDDLPEGPAGVRAAPSILRPGPPSGRAPRPAPPRRSSQAPAAADADAQRLESWA